MSDIVSRIEFLLNERGSDLYGGEAVTQTQHALQCATLAESAKADAKLITASLLHDIGHFLEEDFDSPAARENDGLHEQLGEEFLSQWFDSAVTEPVKLHVAAKRYLCGKNPAYFDSLSPASVKSLELQGGPMTEPELQEFEQNEHYKDALRLRTWDDLAKDPDKVTPGIAHFMNYVSQSLK